MVHRELLALDRARELDAEALSLARERPVTWAPEADALLNLVVDDVRVGNVERAEAALSDLERRSGETNWLTWMNELRLRTAAAEHWAARGEWSRATEMAARLLDHARRVGARGYVCSAERVRLAAAVAEDRDVEPAIRRLEEAIEGLRDFEAPLETWTSWRLLGRAYSISGRVVRGDGLGRKLGFPTANVQMKHNRPPLTGIFAVHLHGVASGPLRGVASLGVRPTVKQQGAPVLEVHALDYDGELYRRHVRVEFLHKFREEEKYADLATLTRRIALDVENARSYFAREDAQAQRKAGS